MDYMACLGSSYPTVFATCIGDPTEYENLQWESGDALPPEDDMIVMNFNNVVADQVNYISNLCQGAIMAGFISSALGTPHQYASGQLDQINLMGAVMSTAPTPANPAGSSIYYKCGAVVGGVIQTYNYHLHTSAQMQQLWADAVNYKMAQLQVFNTKQLYLLSLSSTTNTLSDIAAVTWTSNP